jgi:hypothetical protein
MAEFGVPVSIEKADLITIPQYNGVYNYDYIKSE